MLGKVRETYYVAIHFKMLGKIRKEQIMLNCTMLCKVRKEQHHVVGDMGNESE